MGQITRTIYRVATVAIVTAGVLTTQASAALLVGPSGRPIGGRWQQWVNNSREPTPHQRLRLVLAIPKPCGNVDGCLESVFPHGAARDWANGHPAVIYVRPSAKDARFALMHELGHAFDLLYLTPADRKRFEYLDGWHHGDGYGYQPWSVDGGDPAGSPNEDFANTYASCSIWGAHPHEWSMNLWQGWDSNWASYRAACELIRSANTERPRS